MNSNVTVTYSMPMDAYWSGSKRGRRAEPKQFNFTLCLLNLSTWMYTAFATAAALS